MTHPQIPKELSLALSVKAMNDTAGPKGLVPSLLLFGEIPRIPHTPKEHVDANVRIKAMETARNEYETILAQTRVRTTLNKRPPPASCYHFRPKQSAYVYREKQKRWTGPHPVTECINKKVLVDLGEKTGPRSFNLSQVKPAKPSSLHEPSAGVANGQGQSTGTEGEQHAVISIADCINAQNPTIHYTEIISPRDPRSGLIDEANLKVPRLNKPSNSFFLASSI